MTVGRVTEGAAAPSTTETHGTIGLLRGASMYVAAVLGTGILVLPALAARVAGPASIVSVAAVLLLSIPLAGTFAALASRFPDAGGVATFVRLALGQTAARMSGYWFFFGVQVGGPVVAILGAQYVVGAFGGPGWLIVVVGVVIYIPPFVVNSFGLRVSGSLQLVLTAILLFVVAGVVATSLPVVRLDRFHPFLPHGWVGVGAAISLFVWAFAGWEAVTHIAAEFRNPRRVIPLATAIAIATVGIAYLALQFVTITALGPNAGASPVPLLDLVSVTLPAYGAWIIAGIALIVSMGVLNAYLPALSKLGASLGRDGHLPIWIAKGAERGAIPRRALFVAGLINLAYFVGLLVTGLDLTPFILIHTSCMVAVYALGMLAAVRLLERWSAGASVGGWPSCLWFLSADCSCSRASTSSFPRRLRSSPSRSCSTKGGPVSSSSNRVFVELSHVIREGLITYPGLPAPTITPHLTREDSRSRYAPGTEFAMDIITMIGNTGTYLDSPWHRYEGGTDLAGLRLETLVDLPTEVFHLQDSAERGIPASAFNGRDVAGKAVLLATGWDRHFDTPAYASGAPYLTAEGVDYLIEQGVVLVGIDSLNIDNTEGTGERPAHTRLLAAGIHVVEHLTNLGSLPASGARFTATPPRVEGFGTFPVRAYARI